MVVTHGKLTTLSISNFPPRAPPTVNIRPGGAR